MAVRRNAPGEGLGSVGPCRACFGLVPLFRATEVRAYDDRAKALL